AVTAFKRTVLEAAWSNFRRGARSDLRCDYQRFLTTQAQWINDYALFCALKVSYDGAYYINWPSELVRREPAAMVRARRELMPQIDKIRFAQFLLFRQARRLKDYARARGLRIIGDLPFFVSPDSS